MDPKFQTTLRTAHHCTPSIQNCNLLWFFEGT